MFFAFLYKKWYYYSGDFKMKRRSYLILGGILIIIVIIGIIVWYNMSVYNKNFIKLSYNEILEKVSNKEDFVLCVSASECTHCKSYKPKLRKISKDYDIKIYYTEINEFSFIESEDEKVVARALLPAEIMEGSKLRYECLSYTLI